MSRTASTVVGRGLGDIGRVVVNKRQRGDVGGC